MARYRYEYDPGTILYGRDCVADLEEELAELDAERAMVVCGRTVGATPAVIDPVLDGLGDRLAAVFDETTPEKRLSTAFDGVAAMREADADILVSLGGGSSLDLAKIMSGLSVRDEPDEAIRAEFEEAKWLHVPEGELTPIATIPTTLPGADLSVAGGLTSRRDGLIRGGAHDGRLMPAALFYDPSLVETTPHEILCASAMNGFDKGIESIYSRWATPFTDATAMRGLRLLRRGLPRLGDGKRDDETLHDSIVGTILVQYGALRDDAATFSIIHALGHGISRGYDIQQGGAHAIVAPHALGYLFDEVDGRRELLAEALGVDADGTPDDVAAAVIDAVVEVRDALSLPARLRSIGDLSRDDLPDIAAEVSEDPMVGYGPDGLEPTPDDLESVLREAW